MGVELLLKLLVGPIDAELLKRVLSVSCVDNEVVLADLLEVLKPVLSVSKPRRVTETLTMSKTPINFVDRSAPDPPSPLKLSLTTLTSH